MKEPETKWRSMPLNTTVHFSKASDEWTTPLDFFRGLHLEFGFTTDAACTPQNGLPVRQHIFSALNTDWSDDGCYGGQVVFVNPPYSKCREFIATAAKEAQCGCTVVCLVPSRTDTRWWHQHVWDAEKHQPRPGVEIRFVKGRLRFGNCKNSAPFPSVVIVFRPPQ